MRRFLLLAVIVLSILAVFPISSKADHQFTVVAMSAEANFPQTITFKLALSNAANVRDIDLQYQPCTSYLIPVKCRIDVDFDPGQDIITNWTWNMVETGGLPPGTEVTYCWLIEQVDGRLTTTSPATVQFDDQRYQWQSQTSGQVTIFWYQGDATFIGELTDAASEALDRLENDIGVSLEQTTCIYVYASASDLQGALIYPQEWTGGLAFYDYGIIVIGIAPDDISWGRRAIAHELGHLVIRQAIRGPYADLPTWLDEGLVMDAEGGLRSDLRNVFEEAVASDALFSLHSISGSFPADPLQAALCYAESYSVVQYLLDNYGRDKMRELLDVFKEGSTCDDALTIVYGLDIDGLNTIWRLSLGLGPQPTPNSSGNGGGMPLSYVALIILVALLAAANIFLLYRLLRRVRA